MIAKDIWEKMKCDEKYGWTFYNTSMLVGGGRKSMIATHRFNEDPYGAFIPINGIGETFTGCICAYVECKVDEVDIAMRSDHVNGGLTYTSNTFDNFNFYRDTFPDSSANPEKMEPSPGNVVIGWDYHHHWNHSVDAEDVINDLCGLVSELSDAKLKSLDRSALKDPACSDCIHLIDFENDSDSQTMLVCCSKFHDDWIPIRFECDEFDSVNVYCG